MALELPPTYHTETMVHILKGQGSTGLAMKLAEQIINTQPKSDSVKNLLSEMKAEAKASFERFRRAGLEKLKQNQAEESPPAVSDPKTPPASTHGSQVNTLQTMLKRVQHYRKLSEKKQNG